MTNLFAEAIKNKRTFVKLPENHLKPNSKIPLKWLNVELHQYFPTENFEYRSITKEGLIEVCEEFGLDFAEMCNPQMKDLLREAFSQKVV